MVNVPPQRDIYEVLGVSRDASPRLAREMYWSQVRRHLEQDDEVDARRAIEELNAALAVVLDAKLRAEYDAQAGRETPGRAVVVEPERGDHRAVLTAVLIALTAFAAVAAYATNGANWAITVLGIAGICMAIAALGMRRERRRTTTAFAFLHLPETASSEDLTVAYRQRVQELLLELRYRPETLAQLEVLDRAYLRAAEVALASERGEVPSPEPEEPPPAVKRAWSVVKREAAGTWAPFGRGLWRIVAGMGWVSRQARAAVGSLQWPRVPRPQVSVPRGPSIATRGAAVDERAEDRRPEDEAVFAEVGRRLAADFGAASTQIASTVTHEDVNVPEHARPNAYLVLHGSAEPGRYPVGELPVRVGSDPNCDVMLDPELGVAPDHLLIWRRGVALLLHVTAPNAAALVNGRPLMWARLEDGDEIRIGDAQLIVEMVAE